MPKSGTRSVSKRSSAIVITLSALLLPQVLIGQTSDPQALTLAAQAMQALNHGLPVFDVTLSGTATQTAGGWQSTGPATLKALGAAHGYAKARADFSTSGQSEIHTLDATGHPIGSWAHSDGVRHAMATHNTFTDAAWFFPALTLLGAASQQGIVARYVGAETHNGIAVKHLRLWRAAEFLG